MLLVQRAKKKLVAAMRKVPSAPTELEVIDPNWMAFSPSNWHYEPHWEVNEKHWLSCGVIMPKHATCGVCGERELDE
jgi:hypothetical protein